MIEEKKGFATWEEVIIDFFERKKYAEEEKYLKEEIKRIGELYAEEDIFNNQETKLIFETRKNKEESSLKFQRRRAVKILNLDKKPEKLNVFEEKEQYKKHIKTLSKKYDLNNWLSINCKNASSVSFATHVIKLTHSKIDSPSIFDSVSDKKDGYLTTSSLKEKIIDGAVAGNQFAPIFQFLELDMNGKKLAEELANDDNLLKCFLREEKTEEDQLTQWNKGFRKALDSGEPATHSLAKQIYFPLIDEAEMVAAEGGNYHLLPNVISSSLAHTIYEKVFDDLQKPVQKSVEKRKYSNTIHSKYIQRSHLSVTASNHSNASQLNGKRGGKLHLFPAQPPTWQSQLKPPINRTSLFSAVYNAPIRTELDYLRDFLLRFKQLDLSIKDPKRKRHLECWVNNIIDEFLFYVASIQNLPSAWSAADNIKLKPEHQYLLDPYRTDDVFQAARQSIDWQSVIRADFAQWLNRQLRGKDKLFTPQAEHTRLWKKLLEQPLREYMEPIEFEIKQQIKEAV